LFFSHCWKRTKRSRAAEKPTKCYVTARCSPNSLRLSRNSNSVSHWSFRSLHLTLFFLRLIFLNPFRQYRRAKAPKSRSEVGATRSFARGFRVTEKYLIKGLFFCFFFRGVKKKKENIYHSSFPIYFMLNTQEFMNHWIGGAEKNKE